MHGVRFGLFVGWFFLMLGFGFVCGLYFFFFFLNNCVKEKLIIVWLPEQSFPQFTGTSGKS